MSPFFVCADNVRERYDTLEFETEEFEFKKILAIISFRKTSTVGYATEYLDTILLCADMEHIPTTADFKFMPYPYYRLRTAGTITLI